MDEGRAALFGAVPLSAPGVPFDLRSDLMTGWLSPVAEAMARAARRPPAMMRGEDPDERALTENLADLLGMEAALFVPTCTMANQIALRLWCAPGSTVLAERSAHVATVEAGATALAGVALRRASGRNGHLAPEAVQQAVQGNGEHPSLVWLENTSMRAGGTIMPGGWQDAISAALRGTDARLHLDGSRLWNAAVGSGHSVAELAAGADTVAVSLNKVVGAPLGAALAGPRDAIARAAELCEQIGGHWRPIGILAAAARAALTDSLERIVWTHEAATEVAARLRVLLGPRISIPETNIVLIACPGTAAQAVRSLGDVGVLTLALDADTIRLVLHGGIHGTDLERLAADISQVFRP